MTNDQFEVYYTEKLWESIPSIYRHEDGIADKPGVLRALVQVLAKQAAILRRSQDALWDDQFIELCNEWAVPYIGELLGTRLLSAQNARGRRIDVAKTIYYRRRKGTPRILEELINDISGWEGKLVEQFQHLARSRHSLDAKPENMAGKFSGTQPGGCADLRNQRVSELCDGPFEEFFHTADFRQHQGLNGRYAITKLAFYLYRLSTYEVINSTPFDFGDGIRFSFDPSGRDIALFSKSLRSPDWEHWRSATEAELPAPIPCRLLGHAVYLITEEVIQPLIALGLSAASVVALRKFSGISFKSELNLINTIKSLPVLLSTEILNKTILLPLLSLSLTKDCGKRILLPDQNTVLTNSLDENAMAVGFESGSIFTCEQIDAANLHPFPTTIPKALAIDAEHGRFKLEKALNAEQKILVAYHYGFSANIGAATYDRSYIIQDPVFQTGGGAISAATLLNNGVTQINDSQTYGPIASKVSIQNMIFQSISGQRPYLRLESDWILNSGTNLNSYLTLDGLWIGALGNLQAKIILRGDFECVVMRSCTIDPGGSKNLKGEELLPVCLQIEGRVENLCIESSILGPIKVIGNGFVEELSVTDSIIQSTDNSIQAIDVKTGLTKLLRSTVFGKVAVHRMDASEALITGHVNVVDTQNGCFRFSAAPKLSRLPHPYESYLFKEDTNHWFTSRRFGDSGYAQLSETSPRPLQRGAENGSEMGAFNSLMNPIKLDGLQNKIDEYMPFGLIPIFINKT